jgi:hypothetical protein
MIKASEDQTDKEGFLIRELMSLAIEPRRKNELNYVAEFEVLESGRSWDQSTQGLAVG